MKHIITYIPINKAENCPISKIYKLTKFNKFQLLIKNCEQLVIKSNNPGLIGITRNIAADKIICFGHKHDEFPILLTSEKEFISADWFGSQFKIGVFFINNSSTLFNTPNYAIWSKKFDHWVAFSETFQPFADYKDSVDLQKQMYKEFLKELAIKRTGEDISNALKNVYGKYIDEFSILCHKKNVDSNNIINTMHVLQMNKESIVYGE